MKKLSVIIPCYNSSKYIKKCLDSIPKLEDIEIITINDGSTDDTFEVLKKYKKEYKDLVIISYKQNKGVSYARNKGINKSIGDYIITIDSDDTINGDIFKEVVDKELNFIDMVFYNLEDNNHTIYEATKYNVLEKVGNFKFIRKDFIGNTKYKVGLQRGEDKLFHKQLMEKCPTMRFIDKVMYYYNFPREGSITDIYNKTGKEYL